mmetsp:Transcript_14717/g.30579  ORF Transcript_14717/g.30579 Transcript_14717/m.30579 type:complete len:205 (-) Transcript_14717:1131-1745(-)
MLQLSPWAALSKRAACARRGGAVILPFVQLARHESRRRRRQSDRRSRKRPCEEALPRCLRILWASSTSRAAPRRTTGAPPVRAPRALHPRSASYPPSSQTRPGPLPASTRRQSWGSSYLPHEDTDTHAGRHGAAIVQIDAHEAAPSPHAARPPPPGEPSASPAAAEVSGQWRRAARQQSQGFLWAPLEVQPPWPQGVPSGPRTR